MFREGQWCIYIDELYYLCHFLGLSADLELLWTQGRSHGVSLVGSTQRPAWVPLFMYSAATHVFFFRHSDETDAKRIANLSAGDPATIRSEVRNLRRHEFLYADTRNGTLLVSKVGA
jgi:DNA helicase HerA-like ATPase